MPLFRKDRTPPVRYDPERQQPAVRKSICTGEMTVGFIDRETGKFVDLMRVDGPKGLEAFMRQIGATEIKTIY